MEKLAPIETSLLETNGRWEPVPVVIQEVDQRQIKGGLKSATFDEILKGLDDIWEDQKKEILRRIECFFEGEIEDISADSIVALVKRKQKEGKIDREFDHVFGFCHMPFLLDLKFKSRQNPLLNKFLIDLFVGLQGISEELLMNKFFAQRDETVGLLLENIENPPQSLLDYQKSLLGEEGMNLEMKKKKSFAREIGERAPYLLLPGFEYPIQALGLKNISRLADAVKKRIDKELEPIIDQFKGFYPIGAKIHFPKAISESKLKDIKNQFGFDSTIFTMMNSNTSMNMPACESAVQMAMILEGLRKMGILDDCDLHMCNPGRLDNTYAGILGSSVLFNSRTCVTYGVGSFDTSQNRLTGSSIMAYDAGGFLKNFEGMPEGIIGRIDMFMRQDLQDLLLYQVLGGGLVGQSAWGGVFEDIGKEYVKDYVDLLKRYDMDHILKGRWVYDKDRDNDIESEKHHQLVKTCTDRWMHDYNHYKKTGKQEGLRYDAKHLLTEYVKRIKIRQKEVFGTETPLLTENLTLEI